MTATPSLHRQDKILNPNISPSHLLVSCLSTFPNPYVLDITRVKNLAGWNDKGEDPNNGGKVVVLMEKKCSG